jgi:RNA polymerase sigma factor (sigma-70 family)
VVRKVRDDSDFDVFFRSVLPAAVRAADRILGSVPGAQDAAGEALARALLSWSRVRAMDNPRGWVLRVTSNVALDMVRRRRGKGTMPELAVFDEVDRATLRVALVAALNLLPSRQREVVVLRYVVGMDEREVAQLLGISENSVRTHRSRALDRLRSQLGGEWKEDELVWG